MMGWRQRIAARLLLVAERRLPDRVIGGDANPYLLRWWLIPRNRLFNIYLHQFRRSDDDRALHDHPWLFNASWLLSGDYGEHGLTRGQTSMFRFIYEGCWRFRWGASPHRVQLLRQGDRECPVWTLFITGPKVRSWGFLCPRDSAAGGWRHWRIFTSGPNGETVGRGCD